MKKDEDQKSVNREILRIMAVVALLCAIVLLTSRCSSVEGEQAEIQRLQKERILLENDIEMKKAVNEAMIVQRDTLKEKIREQEILVDGDEPLFVLDLELKQSHMSLDLGEHMKDAMNAVKFSLPVAKALYEDVNVGDELLNEFREGSFWTKGSIGSWKITVKGKHIEEVQ